VLGVDSVTGKVVSSLVTDVEGNRIWVPIVVAIVCLIGLAILHQVFSVFVLNRTRNRDDEDANARPASIDGDGVRRQRRVWRGVECGRAQTSHR
jgi:hypothetical protein